MKFKEKKLIEKKQFIAVCLLILFAVLLTAAIILGVVNSKKDDTSTKKDPPEIIEGESTYLNYAIVYPAIEQKNITYIEVMGPDGTYGMMKSDDSNTLDLYYKDKNGKDQFYYPNIMFEDSSFSYDSIYAIETGDGMGMLTKLSYFCSAIMRPYFDERIAIPVDEAEKAKLYKAYGLEDGKTTTVKFSYSVAKLDEAGNTVKDENGNAVTETKSHSLTIGKQDITGQGYYFTVDGRPYIYASQNSYFTYILAGMESLVKSTLVAAGVSSDKGFGPYLTQGYYQWKTEQFKETGEVVKDGSSVITFTDVLTPPTGDEDNPPADDGYVHTGYSVIETDLSKYKNNDAYKALISALVGKQNGSYGDMSGIGNLVYTVTHQASSERLIEFGEAESVLYTYTIDKIESVFTENGEIFDTGYAVGANKRIKISYTVTVGEKTLKTVSVLNLDSLDAIINGLEGAEAEKLVNVKNTLSSASVGSLTAPISFSVSYNKENAESRLGKYKITEILAIYDKNEIAINKVVSDAVVDYRYVFEVDGVVWYEEVDRLNLAMAETETDKKIANVLMSKGVSRDLNIVVDEYTAHYELMSDFTTYKTARIDYFVTNELVSAFKFANASLRDPYYGESLYENLLTNEYSLYGINYDVCQGVVKLLGGIDADGESVSATGLSGLETVAIGITPEIMNEYKLYAHKIEFTLPRGISAYTPDTEDEGGEESVSEYTFYDQITFTLYISDEDPLTGMRYVGSDMYDLVAKVNADDFFFLDEDFASFWARRNILLVDVEDIANISVELGFEDMKGKYNYELGTRVETSGSNKVTVNTVKVTTEGECTETAIIKYMAENNYPFVSMEEFFNKLYAEDPEKDEYAPHSLGSTYFKEALLLLYSTEYEGILTDAEKAKAKELNKCLMRIKLNLNRGSAYTYVYEFYALDSTKVAVSIHKENASGEVVAGPAMDFYISTFALKKVAKNGFFDLMNGIKIDPEVGYPDEKGAN